MNDTNLNYGTFTVARIWEERVYGYDDRTHITRTQAVAHPPLKSAQVSAEFFRKTIRLTAEELNNDPAFYSLAQIAAQQDKAFTAELLEWEKKDVVIAAVAICRAEWVAAETVRVKKESAERKAAEKTRVAAEKKAAKKKEANALTAKIPLEDETVKLLADRLRATPNDDALAGALADRWYECGVPHARGKVFAMRIARLAKCKAAITADGSKGGKLRAQVREIAGCGGSNNVGITIVTGERADESPRVTGDAPYSTFKNGGVCQSPGAAMRAGYKVEYHADTREVTIGVAYLAKMITGK